MIDENKIVFEESKFGILVNCETHTRQNDYQVPSHYCKVYHSETLPIFYPCGAKKNFHILHFARDGVFCPILGRDPPSVLAPPAPPPGSFI